MIRSLQKNLSEGMKKAKKAGFTTHFRFQDNRIYDPETYTIYNKNQCTLIDYFRYEADHDPSAVSMIFLIRCNDGKKGCLLGNFGTYLNPELMEFALSLSTQQEKENDTK